MYGAEAAGGQFGADWNGGHTFSQSAVDFGLQEYIEPEVAQKNPQLSPTEIRFEATRILALRLAQDLSFDRKETLREEEMVTKWEVAEIDGKKQLVTRYGNGQVSLEELWHHTEEFALRVGKPEAFNRAEMQTQLAIQDALIAGRATSVAFTLSHPESVRYVQHWQRREDGAFYSTQIDIGNHAGRDLRHDEVKGFLDRFRDQHRDTAIDVEGAVAGSYVAVRGSMDITAIPRTVKLHAMTHDAELFERRVFSLDKTFRSDPEISDRAFPLWVVADRRWFSDKGEGEERSNRVGVAGEAVSGDFIGNKETRNLSHPVETIHNQEKQPFPIKTRLRQEIFSDGELLRKEHKTRWSARKSLQIIMETGVALHATPVILSRLAEKLPAPVRVVEKSMRRHERKELRIKNYELRKAKREAKKETAKMQHLKPERVEPFGKGKERKKPTLRGKVYMEIPNGSPRHTVRERVGRKDRRRGKRGSENGVKKVAAASKMIPSTSEKREKKRLRRAVEKSMRRHKKRELRRIARREVKKDSVKVQPLKTERVEPFKERKQSIQRKEREAVAGMVFGWVVWMMLTRKDNETPKNIIIRHRLASQDDVLQNKVETPWVLLSIIWYLTAIREQGMHNYPIKKKRRTLPKKGVIFAYAS